MNPFSRALSASFLLEIGAIAALLGIYIRLVLPTLLMPAFIVRQTSIRAVCCVVDRRFIHDSFTNPCAQ